jgi:Flp pilus assembly CpaF family ATPase
MPPASNSRCSNAGAHRYGVFASARFQLWLPRASETLKGWNTGHPGGLSTIHANSAAEAINRLDDLIGEVATKAPKRLIQQAVDVVVFIRRTVQGRKVEEIVARQRAP